MARVSIGPSVDLSDEDDGRVAAALVDQAAAAQRSQTTRKTKKRSEYILC